MDLFSNVQRSTTQFSDNVNILSIASFDIVKGIDILLHAFLLVLDRFPKSRLILVGESGRDDEYLRGVSERLGIAEHVEWRCNVLHASIPSMLAEAALFVLPSRNEGLSLALLEAGAAGLPAIATRVGGIPELIDDGRDGLLVPPEDPRSLGIAILWALDNRDRAIEMGLRLRQKVADRFTWAAVYSRYERLIPT